MKRIQFYPALICIAIMFSLTACSGTAAKAAGGSGSISSTNAGSTSDNGSAQNSSRIDHIGSTGNAGSTGDTGSTENSSSSESIGKNLTAILSSLKNDSSVKQYEVSHNSQKIAVVKTKNADDLATLLSIISVGTKQEAAVNGIEDPMQLYGPEWSYDDSYLSVNNGTAIQRTTYIVDADSWKIQMRLPNMNLIWGTNQNKVAYTDTDSSVKPDVLTELDGSVRICIANAETKKQKIVIPASPRYNYTLTHFDAAGKQLTFLQNDMTEKDNTFYHTVDTSQANP